MGLKDKEHVEHKLSNFADNYSVLGSAIPMNSNILDHENRLNHENNNILIEKKNIKKLAYLNAALNKNLGSNDKDFNDINSVSQFNSIKPSFVNSILNDVEQIEFDNKKNNSKLNDQINEMNRKIKMKNVPSYSNIKKNVTNNSNVSQVGKTKINIIKKSSMLDNIIEKKDEEDIRSGNISAIDNSNTVNLDFIEIKMVKLTGSKLNQSEGVLDSVQANVGTSRINLEKVNLSLFVKVLTNYESLVKDVIDKLITSKNNLKSKITTETEFGDPNKQHLILDGKSFIKENYDLKKLMSTKISKILSKLKISDNNLNLNNSPYDFDLLSYINSIQDYHKLVLDEIKKYESFINLHGRLEINYLFSIILSKKLDFSFNSKEILIACYKSTNSPIHNNSKYFFD